jgi:hypothetical protein
MLNFKQMNTLENKLNRELKPLFYLHDLKEDDINEIEAYNMVYNFLSEAGFKINTDRKSENILKLDEHWHNGTRIHISIKRDTFEEKEILDNCFINYISNKKRKSLYKDYIKLASKTNLDNDVRLCMWYVLIY